MIAIRPIYALAAAGFVLAAGSAFILAEQSPAEMPLFKPVTNPYPNGIYANGMIESVQAQGIDIALNPEVTGKITQVLVREGQSVRTGQPLLTMDDSIQRGTTQQLDAAAAAATTQLAELKAEPRGETLAVAVAQSENAAATVKNAAEARTKQDRAFELDPRSVSRDTLDTARNAEAIAATAYKVAKRNEDLIRAGAWRFDIENQTHQAAAAAHAAEAAHATLDKFVLRSPRDGVVLAISASNGSSISPAGVYDTRSQATLPVITFGTPQTRFQVRAYVDEILVPQLPTGQMQAVMNVRGSDQRIALRYERVEPYLSPKISLSDQRQERVDLRVLPVIFTFARPSTLAVYPGQMVDIYIGGRKP
jgi:HlyD family secretion protein